MSFWRVKDTYMAISKSLLEVSTIALVCMMAAAVGFAQTPQSSTSGTPDSKTTKPVQVSVPDSQKEALSRVMHSKQNSCFVEDMTPDDDSSMIVLCGIPPEKVIFSP
jgi:hypothetical protein